MSHQLWGLISNVTVVLLLMRAIITWNPESQFVLANKLSDREFKLHQCARLQAGLKNLEDVVEQSSETQKTRLQNGLSKVRSKIAKLQKANLIPRFESCSTRFSSETQYVGTMYRLNEIDQPNRRVNWSYRVVSQP